MHRLREGLAPDPGGFGTGCMDWKTLRNALIFLGISALLSGSMMIGGAIFLDGAEDRRDARERRLQHARLQHGRIREEMAMVDTYLPQFERFAQAGLIGEERRLTWLEALRAADRRIGLPELRYRISSRGPQPGSPRHGPYRLYATEMQLTMGLLHEGDLFSVLAELDRHAVGAYSVTYCSLRRAARLSGTLAPDANRPNLHSECKLRWHTLDVSEK